MSPYQPMRSHRVVFAGVLLIATSVPAMAQHAIRADGPQIFDSTLNDRRDFVRVDAGGHTTYLLTAGHEALRIGDTYGTGYGILPTPPPGTFYTEVAAGLFFAAGLRSDGQLLLPAAVPLAVPSLPAGLVYTDASAGNYHVVALRSDGIAVAIGTQPGTPPLPPTGVTYVQIAAGGYHAAAVQSDGQIAAWGTNSQGESTVPALPPGLLYSEVACGAYHTMARRSDGSIVAWGDNSRGQCNVPALPPGVTYLALDAEEYVGAAVRSDGTIVVWGDASQGQANVPTPPSGLTYLQVSVGTEHVVALRSDGAFVAWGDNTFAECNVPALPPGVDYRDVAPTYFPPATNAIQAYLTLLSNGQLLVRPAKRQVVPPVPPLPPGVTYEEIAGSASGPLARRSDGAVLTWSATGVTFAPTPPPGTSYVSLAPRHALRSDGVAVAVLGSPAPLPPPGRQFVDLNRSPAFDQFFGILDDHTVIQGNGSAWAPGQLFAEVCAPAGRRLDGSVYYQGLGERIVPSDTTYVGLAWDSSDLTAVLTSRRVAGRLADGSAIDASGVRRPPPPPGMSYLRVYSPFLALMGPASTYVEYAPGCAGSTTIARLVPVDTPLLGRDFRVEILGVPGAVAAMLTGFSNTSSSLGPLPFDGTSLGLPGCFLATSVDEIAMLVASGGRAEYARAVPDAATLLGLPFYQQALVADPSANAFGAVLSAAMTGRLGR